MEEILEKVKLALRVKTDAFDTQLTDLIESALADLGIAGVTGVNAVITDPLIRTAVITYCRINFGQPDDYERLVVSYEKQKGTLMTATNYTVWGASDGQIRCD